MGIFADILGKLGIGSAKAKPAPDIRPYGPKAGAPVAISEVDVVAQLEKRAAASPGKLNLRTSIVDLMKLIDMDSSLSERKALAAELDCPANLKSDSASMNMWLHKEVLRRVAANGGNVPANLLD